MLCQAVEEGRFAGVMRLPEICTASGVAQARSNAVEEALLAGRAVGAFRRHSVMEWSPDTATFRELATALLAVTLYRKEIHADADTVEVVLTPPGPSSQLRTALRRRGWQEADLEHTDATLRHLATQTKHRLIVLSPFVDATGAANLVGLFEATPPGVRRILITRCKDGIVPEVLQAVMPTLGGLGVQVHNYWLPQSSGYETSHAKVVLSDGCRAYVGSANMTLASLAVSMELGTVVSGKSVQTVANVLEAILEIAPKVY
jgi:phosphatidylserine/phosphatidylglycerophosphate/cardiolipin synthase-like enzyme